MPSQVKQCRVEFCFNNRLDFKISLQILFFYLYSDFSCFYIVTVKLFYSSNQNSNHNF